ncbi:hypothetical protein BS78_07G000900 [Paspalum vaginatum]|nr:hypothetical protein BS78_07G000900 [Paspalum vaginatum]
MVWRPHGGGAAPRRGDGGGACGGRWRESTARVGYTAEEPPSPDLLPRRRTGGVEVASAYAGEAAGADAGEEEAAGQGTWRHWRTEPAEAQPHLPTCADRRAPAASHHTAPSSPSSKHPQAPVSCVAKEAARQPWPPLRSRCRHKRKRPTTRFHRPEIRFITLAAVTSLSPPPPSLAARHSALSSDGGDSRACYI